MTPEPAVHPLQCSRDLLPQPGALRARFEQEGYVFLRGVLPADTLLALRRDITAICARHGWIRGGAATMDAIAVAPPCNEGEERYFAVYDEVQKLESLHALAHEPALLGLMRALLGESAFPHPLGIVRLMFPDNAECTTPPHQDFPNNQGTPDLYASWIPLGDCPLELGGVAILERSHTAGLLPLAYSLGAGTRQAVLDEPLASRRWLASDYRAGDVLVFHSMTVHRALLNRTTDRMRLSCDFRYQRQGEALVARSLQPHFGRLGWEEIYRGWHSTRLQYYWKGLDYRVVDWDEGYHRLPDDHLKDAIRLKREYDRRRFGASAGA